jgi:hypothetical protein
MTKAKASQLLQVCAIAFVIVGIALFVAAGRVRAGESDLVAGAERDVMRSRLDQEGDQ